MSACLSEFYHKVGGFVWVKRAGTFFQFSIPFILSTTTNQYQPITTNLTINTAITPLTNLIIIFTRYTIHSSISLKPPNIPYNKTLYITNTIIPLHHKKLLNAKIEPYRTISYY